MKNFLLILSVVNILFLASCKDSKVEDDDVEINDDTVVVYDTASIIDTIQNDEELPVINVDSIIASGKVSVDSIFLLGLTNDSTVNLGRAGVWANFNLGASTCYEIGDYYAWGETITKESYDKENSEHYGHYGVGGRVVSGIIYGRYSKFYDAAVENWGYHWYVPSYVDIENLIRECDIHELTIVVSPEVQVSGEYLKSKTTGNSIFLPCTGYVDGTERKEKDRLYYWTDSYQADSGGYAEDPYGGYCFDGRRICERYRYKGMCIRPKYTSYIP